MVLDLGNNIVGIILRMTKSFSMCSNDISEHNVVPTVWHAYPVSEFWYSSCISCFLHKNILFFLCGFHLSHPKVSVINSVGMMKGYRSIALPHHAPFNLWPRHHRVNESLKTFLLLCTRFIEKKASLVRYQSIYLSQHVSWSATFYFQWDGDKQYVPVTSSYLCRVWLPQYRVYFSKHRHNRNDFIFLCDSVSFCNKNFRYDKSWELRFLIFIHLFLWTDASMWQLLPEICQRRPRILLYSSSPSRVLVSLDSWKFL